MASEHLVAPKDVFSTIEKLLLRDGFDIVIDMENSKGSHVIDSVTGTDWLDFYTFFASAPFGMNHPKLDNEEFKEKIFRAAINKVANSDIYTQEMADFVKTFGEVAVPEGYNHVFFIDLRHARRREHLQGRDGLEGAEAHPEGQNHARRGLRRTQGHEDNALQRGLPRTQRLHALRHEHNDPNKHQRYAKFTEWPRIINPKITFPLEEHLGEVEWLEANTRSSVKNALMNDPDGIAAVIIETIQGEGGDNHFRTEFFKQLRQICDENEMLLIFDEVQCGMGITGKMWAWEHHAPVKPDLFSFGKKAQICGVIAGPRIDEVENNCFKVSSRLNSTWGGTVVDMVRSQRYLEIYRDEKILDYVSNVAGPALYNGLKELEAEFPKYIRNVRGKGLMCAYDICSEELRNKFLKACQANHMLILGCGANTVRFRPALNVPLEDIKLGIEISRKAAREVFGK